ncbi:hypothetical protein [Vibrio penaeicida]|uniref:hypothetical protein n=1 Tax=Vibrio penaeicida TaxID=104609 RepID=UPI001CC52E92|nr:hypothetical protein [Vibrio penaeicida]
MYHLFHSIYDSLFTPVGKKDKRMLKDLGFQTKSQLIEDTIETLSAVQDTYGLLSLLCFRRLHSNGCPTLFINSKADFDYLLKLQYDYKKLDPRRHLTFEHNTFSVALPKGIKVDGQSSSLQGFLVTVGDRDYYDELCAEAQGLRHAGEEMIKVMFRAEDGTELCVSLEFENIPLLLQSKTADEFDKAFYINSNGMTADLTQFERVQQFTYLKLVVALAIYEQAMPDDFSYGFPDSLKLIHLPKSKNFTHYAPKKISIGGVSKQQKACVVAPFLRQLSDPKYYRGEHKDKPIGSRWILVKMHTRNQRISPRTVRVSN